MAAKLPSTMQTLSLRDRSKLQLAWSAITGNGIGHGAQIMQRPLPPVAAHEVLVRVKAVACNPTDNLHADLLGVGGSILGCDYAGVVQQVGANAPGGWKVGDRIAGVVHGGLFKDKGAYAEYLKIDGDLAWRPPADMSDADAATYGVSATTAMQALFSKLDLPWPAAGASRGPSSTDSVIFVYGGSAAASAFAIQMASLAGWQVVTVCSPKNFDLVKSLGATAAYDYKEKDVVAQIRADYPKITRAFDGISTPASTKFCLDLVKSSGGKICVLLDTRKVGKGVSNVDIQFLVMYTLFGHAFAWLKPLGPMLGFSWPAIPEDRALLAKFYAQLPSMVKDVRPLQTTQLEGGFEALPRGMQMLKDGKVSGSKLVVQLSS